ncbi:hypothetical protein CYMTET_4904 [Cymbomonas tetramitiformis]|uniref:Uncharacterized protein n=1 Tax=Cymbomonas tetramitiformis TaxID=36881 RepID=A0AAE0H0A2_9CHLO|nr:hypothetical protein CYMTET_4904 [Cymbomonas tetramitiformis]
MMWDGRSDPIVRMSLLRQRPTPRSRAATSAEFHADSSVWASTPVRASQRAEFADKLDYAFAYGEELAKLLRAHGFKSSVGIALDGPEAESHFTVLLANMSHVFGPIARDDFVKLLDLDFEYEVYHLTLNDGSFTSFFPPFFAGLPSPCTRSPLACTPTTGGVEGIGDPDAHRFWVRLRAVVIDETVDPAPQLAVFRTLAEKHRKLRPGYGDPDMVSDLHSVLRSSAAASPYITPLYLVVVRDLSDGKHFTFASLALRLGKVFQDESPLARPTTPAPKAPGGAGRIGGGKPTVGTTMAFGKKKFAPPAPPPPAAPPPLTAWPLSAAATPQAHSLQELEPPPQAASPPQGAAAMTVRLSTPVPTFAHGPMDPQSMAMDPGTYSTDTSLPAEDCVGGGGVPPPISSLHICDLDDDDTDWPAFRESPVWTPPVHRPQQLRLHRRRSSRAAAWWCRMRSPAHWLS